MAALKRAATPGATSYINTKLTLRALESAVWEYKQEKRARLAKEYLRIQRVMPEHDIRFQRPSVVGGMIRGLSKRLFESTDNPMQAAQTDEEAPAAAAPAEEEKDQQQL